MFTGLVQAVGSVREVRETDAGARLVIDAGSWDHRPNPGDSIAVSGCCLTLADEPDGPLLSFDAVPQTLGMTTLGSLVSGSRVNLEHSARPDTLLGGHIVQGHVDGVAEVVRVSRDDGFRVRVAPPPELMKFITPKGSVTLEGVSLTIADTGDSWFEVALIPTTLDLTTLSGLEPGQRCNLETDILARTVVHFLEHWTGDMRRQLGFTE